MINKSCSSVLNLRLSIRIILAVVLTSFICFVFAIFGKSVVHKMDVEFLNEMILDAYGLLVTKQDWDQAAPLARKMDYSWLSLENNSPFLRVAHALGQEPSPNTEEALKQSIKKGFKLLEVDLWLDNEGYLRCHHGPTIPLSYKNGDCTFTSILDYVERDDIWLILDIKSDFVTTGNSVLNTLHNRHAAQRIIFQLYLPEHSASLNSWAALEPLPGPIVTAYVHRSLRHIVTGLDRLGVRAFTFPLHRYGALPVNLTSNLTLLTYPVHDCTALHKAEINGIRGIYTSSALSCN